MKNKTELIEQTKLAFEFISKLYIESSYLIKEIERILMDEEERFVIGKPSGYGITSRSSAGIETNYVYNWLLRKFAVFFVPDELKENVGGQTVTKFMEDLKVLYVRIILDDNKLEEPQVVFGTFYDMEVKKESKKFETLMAAFEYHESKFFRDLHVSECETGFIKLKKKLSSVNLFDINDGQSIHELIVKPMLSQYRSI